MFRARFRRGNPILTYPLPSLRYNQSSSCAPRSAVICYNIGHKFVFDTSSVLKEGGNEIVLSLPFNATNYASAVLPNSVYVQYDALRLEIE